MANEGDARDYDCFGEETRVEDLALDPTLFPNASTLQEDDELGRLRTTEANGDLDDDGDNDVIYSFGGRSFSFVQYANTRDFSGDAEAGTAGDLGAEGALFIPREQSPIQRALLVLTNELSGTVTIYSIKPRS